MTLPRPTPQRRRRRSREGDVLNEAAFAVVGRYAYVIRKTGRRTGKVPNVRAEYLVEHGPCRLEDACRLARELSDTTSSVTTRTFLPLLSKAFMRPGDRAVPVFGPCPGKR